MDLACDHGDFTFPGFGECGRIVHREFVEKDIRGSSGKAFDQVQILVGAPETVLSVKFVESTTRVLPSQCPRASPPPIDGQSADDADGHPRE